MNSRGLPHTLLIAVTFVLGCVSTPRRASSEISDDLRQALYSELAGVEIPSPLAKRLAAIIDDSTESIMAEPTRKTEAIKAMRHLSKSIRLHSLISRDANSEDVSASPHSLDAALVDICPVWPVCK